MASERVKELINAFRAHFAGNTQGEVPVALQQESFDIVYTALLEDDPNPMPTPAPLMDTFTPTPPPSMGMGPADLDVKNLLNEALGGGEMGMPAEQPMAPQMAPQMEQPTAGPPLDLPPGMMG